MKYNFKILYISHDGQPGVIGVNASSMLEAAKRAAAIQDGLEEVAEIKGIELVATKKGGIYE